MKDTIAPTNKRELMTYIQHVLGTHESPAELEEIASTVMGHVREVMKPYINGERSVERQQYYSPLVNRVENAYARNDYETLHILLQSLVGLIELE